MESGNRENNFSKKLAEEEFKRRFAYVKSGKAALATKNFIEAATFFSKFLSIIADAHQVDAYALKPSLFNGPSRVLERFMISNVYWEMAKIFSMSPKMDKDLQKSLNQFTVFTVNQPYQVLNSELIRKHIKRAKITHGVQHFKVCQKTIFVKSKKCFIATECFGENDYRTHRLRAFKTILSQNDVGLKIIDLYYLSSPYLIHYLHRKTIIKKFSVVGLNLFSKFFTKGNLNLDENNL